ncbi:MAG TPA: FAD-dependent oxidoreductase [Candidatus Binatia bacterium]|nr:FAD-dependent oxidoreductase [Candidatus Binatia bacterium]
MNPGLGSGEPRSAAGRRPADDSGAARALICECAGTMAENIDFDLLERGLRSDGVAVERRRIWCDREGRARLLELLEEGGGKRRLVLVGCAADFAAQRFLALRERGLRLETADIREGCSWVHGGARDAVTDKALRIARAAVGFPERPERRAEAGTRVDRVVVIGGGLAGTHAATELARMGHQVDLLERRPFLGGRSARIGSVFPTGDCGPCLPVGGTQPGVRRCLHRNPAIDQPNLRVRRQAEVVSVSRDAANLRIEVRAVPAMIGTECIDCGLCDQACAAASPDGQITAILREPYDGRVLRAIDLARCTLCGSCAEACPIGAIDLRAAADLEVLEAGAVLIATGCEPAPASLVTHLGYGGKGVLTQAELAERLDRWEEQSWLGLMPARHLVMIQCAGSRDQRRLPYCSRLCCMIALKHAIRLRRLFPEMRITICFQELRTTGARDEAWYLAARRAGVEFLRGSPAAVERDREDGLVVQVEDLASSRLCRLHPDIVVLSTGLVPAPDGPQLAKHLGAAIDEAGFVAPLDAKNRTVETGAEGVFVCGSATGPKTIAESITEASAAAGLIHQFLMPAPRRGDRSPDIDPARCVGCGACVAACPFDAIRLAEREPGEQRPDSVRADAPLATVDAETCRGCGICAASCPELAIAHPLDDRTLMMRLETLIDGAEHPVVGFACAECAGAALSLGGRRRDRYPENVRLIELPCLGRLSALHLVEAVRLGAEGIFLAGCVEGRCQYRSGDGSAAEQVALAAEVLHAAGRSVPTEIWRLCAIDHGTIGHRIRGFCARVAGERLDTTAAEPSRAAFIGAG